MSDDDLQHSAMDEADAGLRETLERGLAGRYERLQAIGSGGMAIVYRARDVRHSRDVALKVLRPELGAQLSAERFQREIDVEARLNHPNVLTLLDSGSVGDHHFYVALWAEQGSLRDRLDAKPTLDLTDALRIAIEVGEALVHAHQNGVVHRDVKPENILFRSGHAMLADFGIARVSADPRLSLTHPGLALGTVHYMSPEQCAGGEEVDGRADQYALACVLFEMLSGDPPFTGRNIRVVIARHMADRPPSLEAIRPDVPHAVVAAIGRALEKRPGDRFPSLEEFLAVLETHRSGAHPVAPAARGARTWLIGAAAAGLLSVGGYLAFRDPAPALATTNVAVLPLEVRGGVLADSGVGIGTAYLIEAALAAADPLRLIDVGLELDAASRLAPQRVPMVEARRIARRARAAWMLRGAIQQHADSVTVILRLFSVGGDSLTRQVSATGRSGEIELHQLGMDALKLLLPYLLEPGRTIDLQPLREQSAPAVALWMQGEMRYRMSRFNEAADFYSRALTVDSTFALAAVKGGQARNWLHQSDASAALLAQALRFESRLPRRYALLARGLLAARSGAADSAVRVLGSAEELAGAWTEAAMAFGDAHYHLLPSRSDGGRRARAAFQRARDDDSLFTPPLYHLAEIALRAGDVRTADDLARRLERAGADRSLLGVLALMRGCVTSGPTPDWMRLVALDPSTAFAAAKALSAGAMQGACAEAAFRSLGPESASDAERWGAFLGLVNLRLARGDARGAKDLVDSIVAAGKGVARSLYVYGYASEGAMASDARALGPYALQAFGADYARLRSTELLWVLSTLHRVTGEAAPLRALGVQLRLRADSSGLVRDRMYAQANEAHLALVLGDTAGAITLLDRLVSRATAPQLAWEAGSSLAPDRLLLAQLLLAQRRPREAFAASLVFDHPEPIAFVGFVAPALRVRFHAASRMGDVAAASEARRRLEALGRQDLLQ